MTWYLVREGGEPIALVASIALAREIVFCQPPGHYIVDEIQGDPLESEPRALAGRRSTRHPDEAPRGWSAGGVGIDDSLPPQSHPTNRSKTPLIPSDPESAQSSV
jgi:hypothetical protein